MKFSEAWLRTWVNPNISTQQLLAQLTMAGLEVETCTPAAADFQKIVVAKVLKIDAHPNAEKLQICTVDVGDAEPLSIVCGADNVVVDGFFPVALIGARLADGHKIKKSKLRGVLSQGMLCSASELGLSEQSDGLFALPNSAPIGQDLREYLDLNDNIIEIDLTPNRGDCLSIEGIAREIAVINQMPFTASKAPTVKVTHTETLAIKVEQAQACPLYCGRVIKNINKGITTPLWMQERLRRSGLRALDPVVDITNYLLLELGQPLHAFDLDKIQTEIVVRYPKASETLVLLNGQEIALEADSLIIADKQQPLALAGIMGGMASAVSDETQSIFLEVAHFTPLAITGKARDYKLHTDSSHRFERGVDPNLPKKVIEIATELLLSIVGGEAGPVIVSESLSSKTQVKPIPLSLERINKVLGMDIGDKQSIVTILQGLGMELSSNTDDSWLVVPPSYRFDIAIEEDLIEELARIYGYDNIVAKPFKMATHILPQSELTLSTSKIKQVLVARGYQEAITYSFIDPDIQQQLFPEQEVMIVANPIAVDLSVMRTSLWPGLLQAVRYNLHRQQSRVRLFETGLCFWKQGEDIAQEPLVAGVITGTVLPEQWSESKPQRLVDFFDIKGDVEAILGLGQAMTDFSFSRYDYSVLHPGQSAKIQYQGQTVGWIGALHPILEEKLEFNQTIFLFELQFNIIRQAKLPKYQALSKYPMVRRDVAIIVQEDVTAEAIVQCISESLGDKISQINVFDIYRGKGIAENFKSMALGLSFQSVSHTLKEEEIEAMINSVIKDLEQQLQATLR